MHRYSSSLCSHLLSHMDKLRVSGEGIFWGLDKVWGEQIRAITATICHRYVHPPSNRNVKLSQECLQLKSRIQLDLLSNTDICR